MDEIDPQERIQELEAEVARYQAEDERRRGVGKKVVGSAAEFATRIHLGKEILPSSRELFEAVDRNLQERRLKFPVDESAELVAAVLQRLLRVRAWAIGFAIVGLLVATVPPYLQWQSNRLLREQIQASNGNSRAQAMLFQKQLQQQTNDTEIVRRAQLIDIIYAMDCLDPPLQACFPRAGSRARQEAVRAFVAIERARGTAPNLRSADLSGTNLLEVDLSDAILAKANLGGAVLRLTPRVNLAGANLSSAVVVGASIADLGNVDDPISILVSGGDLSGANLVGANLSGVNLAKVDLSGANLSGANLLGANLYEANLSGTLLDMVVGLTQEELNETAKGDETTRLPLGLTTPPHWFIDKDQPSTTVSPPDPPSPSPRQPPPTPDSSPR